MEEKLLTSGEVARRLGVSSRTVSLWAQTGQLVPDVITMGGRNRFLWSSVERQMRERRQRDQDTP